ncbi:transcriptional regulator TyrR [Vibrio sp. SS-MA-C1-2]|uniref:transcriptional regulator TyrR n=1 Tax=Vibrio sp. SS-MA-C1-2 TaxID=2908646 RepID=UPI001F35A6A0|nr:transcriptional regulator TyrR [Vibrio sp. SS-MA-C1-2]UJF19988.1 transcriptional regulator TyrR [Vibrio sp. SS-MA-C1-2]
MKLEVFCTQRLGLAQELLELLVKKQIDLLGMEVNSQGIVYIHFPEIDFDLFSHLMSAIRLIPGVNDVKKVVFMPSERDKAGVELLLNTFNEPVFTITPSGKIEFVNLAACQAFTESPQQIIGKMIQHYIPQPQFARWLDSKLVKSESYATEVAGEDYLLTARPLFIDEESQHKVLANIIITLKPVNAQKATSQYMINPDINLGFEHFVGNSNRHFQLINQAKKLALFDAPLLIQGETGTGKEMLARSCHQRSERRSSPFLVLNCISMPDSAAESEIFGSIQDGVVQKGIFEQADGGTVFLYEVGEMSSHLQEKLLRFLQDSTFRRVGEEHEIHVNVRVICSTKKQLTELVMQQKFREDLFYRLNVLTLTIPPLRERASDIESLLNLFISQISLEMKIKQPRLDAGLVDFLSHYSWPGNVRQLKNVIYRALTQLTDDVMRVEHIQLPDVDTISSTTSDNIDGSLDDIMKRHERSVLSNLYKNYPSTRKLATRLGVSHTAIANKLREYGINKK